MRVGALWRYPVKSMQGMEAEELTVTSDGVKGDRRFGFIDAETERVVSAKHSKRYPGLFQCRAELLEDSSAGEVALRVTLPDGEVVEDERISDAVSRLVGRELRLAANRPEGSVYEEEWPESDGVMPEELQSALRVEGEGADSVIGLPTAAAGAPGSFVDFAPLHALTTRTLAHLRSVHPDGAWEARRFRPNLLIDDGDEPGAFTEDAWMGGDLLVGDEVRLRVAMPTPRCVMTTLAQEDIPRDPAILRTVAEHNRQSFEGLGQWACAGAYLEVVQPGVIRRGDPIRAVPGDVEGPAAIAQALEGFKAVMGAGR